MTALTPTYAVPSPRITLPAQLPTDDPTYTHIHEHPLFAFYRKHRRACLTVARYSGIPGATFGLFQASLPF